MADKLPASIVHRTQMRELSHLQKAQHYEIKDYLQMSYATKSSLDLLEMLERQETRFSFLALG